MEDWKIILGVMGVIILLFALLLSIPKTSEPTIPMENGNLQLNNKTMICDYYYICFLRDGKWHKPAYNAGTNLILAKAYEINDTEQIKEFFESEKINLVVNTTEYASSENSELILKVAPFSHYLGYYYNTVKKENKSIETFLLSQYTSTEPSIIILGPGLGAEKNSIEFDGKNILVKGKDSEGLSQVLGKLLLIIVS